MGIRLAPVDPPAVPAEEKHNPVSGEMAVGVSNRGSMTDLAVNVDLTKPRKALISTRIEARIRNGADNVALWEGRASIVTREDGSRAGGDAGLPGIAARHDWAAAVVIRL